MSALIASFHAFHHSLASVLLLRFACSGHRSSSGPLVPQSHWITPARTAGSMKRAASCSSSLRR